MTATVANLGKGLASVEIETSAAHTQAKSNRGGPVQEEIELARRAKQTLARQIKPDANMQLRIGSDSGGEELLLPAKAATLLLEILKHMTKGLDVVVTPLQPELTTGQAAEILNVSRPHLVKLLESGEIPFHKVGRNRRIRREDVMVYSEVLHRQRDAFLDRLVAESQELGLYD
ncbi:MAG: helix-turn-helix domain-containing protein [Chloroflexi bacterium]|nr:helix-turn-helix domain-containing protein [Chloroflexota bacterium]